MKTNFISLPNPNESKLSKGKVNTSKIGLSFSDFMKLDTDKQVDKKVNKDIKKVNQYVNNKNNDESRDQEDIKVHNKDLEIVSTTKEFESSTDILDTKQSLDHKDINDLELTKEQIEALSLILQAGNNTILEEISNLLNITQEELQGLLEDFELSSIDLLDKENALKFYTLFKDDSNLASLITNEDITGEYIQFMDLLEETKQDLNFVIEQELGKEDIDFDILRSKLASNKEKLIIDENQTKQNNQIEVNDSKANDTSKFTSSKIDHQSDNKGFNIFVDNQKDNSSKSDDRDNKSMLEQNNARSNEVNNNINLNQIDNQVKDMINHSKDIYEVSKQIIDQVKVKLRPDQTTLEIKLYPEHLGKLTLEVASKNGLLTAKFIAESQITKEVIESQLNVLQEQLHLQGIKVEEIEVEVGISQFFHNEENRQDSDQARHNQGRKNTSSFWQGVDEEGLFDNLVLDDLLISYEENNINTNTVNYSA